MCSLSNWISPVPMLNDATGGKFSKLSPGLKYMDPATMVGTKLRESEDRSAAKQQRAQQQTLLTQQQNSESARQWGAVSQMRTWR
jgi:hypothetical protein